jgi:hypothetical protein
MEYGIKRQLGNGEKGGMRYAFPPYSLSVHPAIEAQLIDYGNRVIKLCLLPY